MVLRQATAGKTCIQSPTRIFSPAPALSECAESATSGTPWRGRQAAERDVRAIRAEQVDRQGDRD
jgi:hypothetical protein